MATVRKLPSGKWRAETYDHGIRKSWTFEAENKKEARRIANAADTDSREAARRSITLEDALVAYIETCKAQGYSPATVAEYTSRKRKSYPTISGKRIDALTVHDIQAQLDARINDGKSVKTVRNDWFLLRAVLSTYAPKLNLSRVRVAKRKSRPKMILREAMPAQIMEAVKDSPADFQIYVALAMFAGLRPSESYALRWRDLSAKPITVAADPPYQVGEISVSAALVRDEKGVYTRKAPKTGSGNRTQTIAWSLFAFIYALKPRGAEDDQILTLKPNSATKRWGTLRSTLPVPEGMRLYDLRHLYATAVANSGASEEELAARMGHSTSSFSHAVYVELFSERQQNTNQALARATDAALEPPQNSEKSQKLRTKLRTNSKE